ncbi:glycosyltransferase [Variovorax paradoxus]|uniref:glycosyltransferase n=1 Tax=Variovorax paradoxus TaxID=34073 RepID=UPI003F51ABA8
MKVSLILTCFNEVENIGALMSDVLGQSRLPDEMVIVDAGSQDGTLAVLKEFETKFFEKGSLLTLHVAAGAAIAHGRNLAIEMAKHEVLAVTDAGCRLDADWLAKITAPILRGYADLVGGFFLPVAKSRFQRVLAALTTANVPGKKFLPSSRSVAFRKSAWERAGRYPEWLKWGEDTYFNTRCLTTGARYRVAADAIVHWEVRRTWGQAFKQFRRYAFGDGLARRFTPSLAAAPAVYGVVLIGLLAGYPAIVLLVPLLGISWVLRKPGIALRDGLYATGLAVTIQAARAYGYLVGWLSNIVKTAKAVRG